MCLLKVQNVLQGDQQQTTNPYVHEMVHTVYVHIYGAHGTEIS
jgi:hypothetical protein